MTGTWGQSQVDLRNYAEAGDAVRLRFEFGADGCTGFDGWYVDDVRAYYCANDPLQKRFLPVILKSAAP